MSSAGRDDVYVLASRRHGTLYIGVRTICSTRLERIAQVAASQVRREYKVLPSRVTWILHGLQEAIAREKQLKHWQRDCEDQS